MPARINQLAYETPDANDLATANPSAVPIHSAGTEPRTLVPTNRILATRSKRFLEALAEPVIDSSSRHHLAGRRLRRVDLGSETDHSNPGNPAFPGTHGTVGADGFPSDSSACARASLPSSSFCYLQPDRRDLRLHRAAAMRHAHLAGTWGIRADARLEDPIREGAKLIAPLR